MNTQVITMDKEAAKAKADAYRKHLARRRDPEYMAALSIYEALEEGFTVIDVGHAIREGGFDEKMRPKLAIARADRRQVRFDWRSGRDVATFDTNILGSNGWVNGRRHDSMVESVNFNRTSNLRNDRGYGVDVLGFAIVPLIPADVRPRGQEKDWHILWEVEQWSDRVVGAKADVDPYLLKRLAGDLFVVLAEWDLTEVERLVTQGRARVQ